MGVRKTDSFDLFVEFAHVLDKIPDTFIDKRKVLSKLLMIQKTTQPETITYKAYLENALLMQVTLYKDNKPPRAKITHITQLIEEWKMLLRGAGKNDL